MKDLVLQEINVSLLSRPDDYKAEDTHMIVETSWINSYNKLEQSKYYLKGMNAEAVFQIFKDMIKGEDKK